MEILCFFGGIVFFFTKSIYALILVFIPLFFRPCWSFIGWFLLALIWAFSHQSWLGDKGMPDALVIAKASLRGQVISIPTTTPGKIQFQFSLSYLNDKPAHTTLLLSCYNHCPLFKTGEWWQFEAKLKKPVNLGNPGAFDYVNWAKSHHFSWTGYIKSRTAKRLSNLVSPSNILSLREKLANKLTETVTQEQSLGILQALTLGITTKLDKSQWDLFRRTGTTHLMVISGSHIGLVAGLCFWVVRRIWSRSSRCCLFMPAAQAASITGFFMALFYALLAGFGAPAQRSIIACFFVFLRNFLSQCFTIWQGWRYALLAVLIFEPHAVLLPGFYLSFIAVASLIIVNHRMTVIGIKKTMVLQLACLFGLMPLSLFWFSYGAVNGFIANLLAIPLVGFVIVPLALLSLFLLQYVDAPIILMPVEMAINGLLIYLKWVDSFSGINLTVSFSDILSPISLMLAFLILICLPIPRMLPPVFILLWSACFPAPLRLSPGDAQIDILDVGQGLAVVINTAKHSLIYDTGVKFYQGGDMGKLALIPYLNSLGIKKIDKIVISHPDLDHRGGLASLEEKYPGVELIVDKVAFYHRGRACHNYPAWQWDGVSFRFFPIAQDFRDKNNSSCVLQIENKAGKVLLTGDIEKLAEEYLLKTYGTKLSSNVLLIPHHGSKTSSSVPFIKQVNPEYAIISAGFDNRYHFPHEQTLKTLEEQKIMLYNTMDCGMLTLNLNATKKFIKPSCYKEGH